MPLLIENFGWLKQYLVMNSNKRIRFMSSISKTIVLRENLLIKIQRLFFIYGLKLPIQSIKISRFIKYLPSSSQQQLIIRSIFCAMDYSS